MTPAAVELALEIRKEIEARYEEADQLRCRAIERAQIEADLAQRRFMMVDPSNRLVADTLEGDMERRSSARWPRPARNGSARDEHDQIMLDEAVRERLVAMTTDFQQALGRPRDAEPRAQATARLHHRGRDARQAAGRRN